MNSRSVLLLAGALLVGLYIVNASWHGMGGAPSELVAQGYPPPVSLTPTVTTTPTPTPTPDVAGYLPVPSGITVTQTTLLTSPYSDLLSVLQDALDQQDPSDLEDMVYGRFNLELGYSGFEGEPVGTMLDATAAGDYLDDFFTAGTNAVVQGYFADSGMSSPCLEVLVHPFSGSVAYPTPVGSGTVGQVAPTTFPLDAASWRFCKTQSGVWIWTHWLYGEYYPTAYFLNQRQRVPDAYYYIRP